MNKIAIIGLGYVGLPLAVEFSKKNIVIGFDINGKRIEELSSGHDSTLEVTENNIKNALSRNENNCVTLSFTSEIINLAECDIFIITVPTPINEFKSPDLTPLKNASRSVGKVIKKGALVIYESTTYPGCTEEVCVPELEKASGFVFNKDFFVGYSPERIVPGDKIHGLVNIPKVTSGSTTEIALKVDDLYSSIIVAGTHSAPSIKVAEASKLVENCQRDVNISLINELTYIFDRVGISIFDVIDAASTKWNFIKLIPGLVGGHCISVDPYYMVHKAQSLNYHPEVITSGRRVNEKMPAFLASRLVKELIKRGKTPTACNCLILGLTFKENCPDMRNSKSIDLVNELKDFGLVVDVNDPIAKLSPDLGLQTVESFSKYDIVVLAVPHAEYLDMGFDYILKDEKSFVFDFKRVLLNQDRTLTL
ncbi:nucleotide sugar dehydrogenase [Amylibacter sp.]|jgi:UDP-N-acetyl-D-glucosamine/UDP-N-acetyl-D-galactosamine dehydrogenase|nr:nucleotide sugar dehydrogenase [Amylibacter sp.]